MMYIEVFCAKFHVGHVYFCTCDKRGTRKTVALQRNLIMGVVKAKTVPKAPTDPVTCIVCGECVAGNPQSRQDRGTHYAMCV